MPCSRPGRPAAAQDRLWAKDIAAARQELVGRGAKLSKVMVGGGLVRIALDARVELVG